MKDLKFAQQSMFGMAYLFGHLTREQAIEREAAHTQQPVAVVQDKYRTVNQGGNGRGKKKS